MPVPPLDVRVLSVVFADSGGAGVVVQTEVEFPPTPDGVAAARWLEATLATAPGWVFPVGDYGSSRTLTMTVRRERGERGRKRERRGGFLSPLLISSPLFSLFTQTYNVPSALPIKASRPLSGGAIAGIVIGVVAAVALAGAIFYAAARRP